MDANPRPPRVLLRPPAPVAPPQNGVFVVGFVGQRYHDVSHLINKIIDSHVFGSGNEDATFQFEPGMMRWLETRKLSYYHHKEHRIVYLQLSRVGSLSDLSDLEDQEFGDLMGLLFMFSVCHLIILIQDGSQFDTQMLKKFRALQAAKYSMGPFFRSLNMPLSGQQTSNVPMPDSGAGSKNPSSGRSRLILNRNAQGHSGMTGLGSYISMSPGQCSPVVLFVFHDDFTKIFPDEVSSETSTINPSSNFNTSNRPGHPVKGSNPAVVLVRRTNKTDGGARKKLQSSLEAQIRFSIKKCRTLSSSESVHGGSRAGATYVSSPLFSLDSSKAVFLIDMRSVQSGESLEYAIGLVEEVLDGKATSDSLLLESHQQCKEDLLSLKEFIFRQSETLSGKGGLVTNNSGSIVAAAAAVAAASTASRKLITVPELPTMEIWSSSSQLILHNILRTKYLTNSRPSLMQEHNAVTIPDDNTGSPDPLESAVSHIDNVSRANTIFSSLWCQKVYPVAKQVYLDGLPRYYSSTVHNDHLKKALRVLTSMVKGPCVQLYLKKLKDECESMWSGGRQLCDAVSLTGNPCIHQRHDTDSVEGAEFKPHSSGFVYLHACACGRSRRLRPDPFGNEEANSMNIFVDCDKNLPSVQLPPKGSVEGFVRSSSSWSIIRVGGARYYDPSKGLRQSGFSTSQRFLLKWMLYFEKPNEINRGPMNDSHRISCDRNITGGAFMGSDNIVSNGSLLSSGGTHDGVRTQIRPSFAVNSNSTKTKFDNVGFSNFTMRKPFSEVVAGASSTNSVHLSKNPASIDAASDVKLHRNGVGVLEKFGEIDIDVESKSIAKIISINETVNADGIAEDYRNGFPTNANSSERNKAIDPVQPVTIYVGYEHECPHGHRFILSPEHLNELGSPYAVVPDDRRQEPEKMAKVINHGRNRRQSNGVMGGGGGRARNSHKPKDKSANGISGSNKSTQLNRRGKDQSEVKVVDDSMKDHDSEKGATTDHGFSISLLDRTLPIYMNCPHCKASMVKNEGQNTQFANTISQLQRIFVVTPSFPILVTTDPVVQFEVSCLPHSVPDRENKLRFSLGCPVILPPESFLSIRLPFVYSVQLEDGTTHSLRPFETEPHLTACIVKGTTLNASNGKNLNPESVT